MINPFHEIDWNPDLQKRRVFGRVLAIGFALIGVLLAGGGALGLWQPRSWLIVASAAGAVIGAGCWAAPSLARGVYVAWYLLGACIGIITSNLLLIVMYYLVLTPFAVLFRLSGRDPLKRRFNRDASSYWEPAEAAVDPERYFRQY
jgi:hypothetical protein